MGPTPRNIVDLKAEARLLRLQNTSDRLRLLTRGRQARDVWSEELCFENTPTHQEALVGGLQTTLVRMKSSDMWLPSAGINLAVYGTEFKFWLCHLPAV